MKQSRRTRAAGQIVATGAHPYVQVTNHPEDGGRFGLYPQVETENDQVTVALPDPAVPAYGLVIVGERGAMDRLGRAIVAAAAKRGGDSPADDAGESSPERDVATPDA